MKGGTLWRQKNFEKSRTVPKKSRKGDSLVPSGFVGYLEKVNKPGTAQVGAISKAQKIELGAFWRQKNYEKVAQCRKKLEGGALLCFPGRPFVF